MRSRRALAENYIARAREQIAADFAELPYLYREPMDREGLEELARTIDRLCGEASLEQ
ncbi:MAG: hypothetical protein M5R36_06715 [Deltaproteobacteria bacterium]|nr:hypothetical protein [Deltaproteobacteria bacterium]